MFDEDGNLLLATGDDTNPFQSDGYAPIDERAGVGTVLWILTFPVSVTV